MKDICPKCKNYIPAGETTCSHCGAQLHAPQPIPHTREKPAIGTELLNDDELPYRQNVNIATLPTEEAKGDTITISRPSRRTRKATPLLLGLVVLALIIAMSGAMTRRAASKDSTGQEAKAESQTNVSTDENETSSATTTTTEDEPAPTVAEEPQADKENEQATSTAAQPTSSKYPGLIGTWAGKLKEPEGSRFCFGATEIPLTLEVKDVTESGMITADLHVCFHGHGNLKNPEPSTEGDVQLDYENVALTYSNGQIRYSDEKIANFPDKTCMVHVILDVADIESSQPKMSGLVSCTNDLWSYGDSYGSQDDHFTLEKQ